MRGFSKVVLAGNLTRDPELRTTPSGTPVCSFAVAVNRVRKGADGAEQEETSYIDCTAWSGLGETISKYMKKGRPFLGTGRLYQHSWEDKNGGGKRSRTEVIIEDFTFIDSGNGGNNSSYNAGGAASATSSAPASNSAEAEVVPDDIPMDGAEINVDDIPF